MNMSCYVKNDASEDGGMLVLRIRHVKVHNKQTHVVVQTSEQTCIKLVLPELDR